MQAIHVTAAAAELVIKGADLGLEVRRRRRCTLNGFRGQAPGTIASVES